MAHTVKEAQSYDDGIGWKKCNRSSWECMVSQIAAVHSAFSGMGV